MASDSVYDPYPYLYQQVAIEMQALLDEYVIV